MKCFSILLATLLLVTSLLSMAESPYAGQEEREIKALSKTMVMDYLSGKGLGFAKAAELNRYPGPSHVLELANELDLAEKQIIQTREIFNSMEIQAKSLGKKFIAMEEKLDKKFSEGRINEKSLKAIVSNIGSLKAEIRYVHLNAHLKQKEVLTQKQIAAYHRLRGYGKKHNHHVH